ncbi:MAG: SpoIIE family protein phosphatase [Planctomycetes bacterium]|nr:SpoIIE family protein phosphatase [Planctomycetota bacterium]
MTTNPHDSDLRDERLERLLAVARRLSASADLEAVLLVVIDALRDLLHSERATVFELDAATQELVAHTAHGLARGELRVRLSQGLVGACARSRAIVSVNEVARDGRFLAATDAATGFVTRSAMAIPLLDEAGELIGVAQVLNRREGLYDARDEALAAGLAAHAAIALKRAHLIADRVARAALERELETARAIQQAAQPRRSLILADYAFAARTIPALSCGGDVCDYGPLIRGRIAGADAPAEAIDGAFFLVADATGHGVGPALQATATRAMLRTALRLTEDLATAVEIVNRQLVEDAPSGRFVTAWFGRLDSTRHELHGICAGQAPILIYRAAQHRFETLGADAIPLGVLDEGFGPLVPWTVRLHPGDAVITASDGYFEAQARDGEIFGEERVQQCLLDAFARGLSPDAAAAALDDQTLAFAAADQTEDDRTVVIVRRAP